MRGVILSLLCLTCLEELQLKDGGFVETVEMQERIASTKSATITSVNPSQLQITAPRTLQLDIDSLPSDLTSLLCSFSSVGKVLSTTATLTSTGVSCPTPRYDLLPSIASGESYFSSVLSVRMINGQELVATNLTFYDCNTFTSCTRCVSSLFPCDWCIDGHKCTYDTALNCRNDILVTAINRIGPSIRSGPSFCPRVTASPGVSTEILVYDGQKKSIHLNVDHIAQFISQARFVCQINIEGRKSSYNAQLRGDAVYCDEVEFTYTSRKPNITATFEIIWGQSKSLDNPDNIHILIYKCKEMANTCATCLGLEEKYQCGWCQATERCELKEQCRTDANISWVHRSQPCGW